MLVSKRNKGRDLTVEERTGGEGLPVCPVETTLTLIGDKWKVLILREIGRAHV